MIHKAGTKNHLVQKPFGPDLPHVVLLGAGATIASGELYGKVFPGMNDLPKVVGDNWSELILKSNAPEGNFEFQYSWIRSQGRFEAELSLIEEPIINYFSSLELPEEATIYDHLVLGLRGKDVIATFNWDPFLLKAHHRNRDIAELPDVRFLHGSVNFASCQEHDVIGEVFDICPHCRKPLTRGSLLFPEHDKDYTGDKYIARDWDVVTNALNSAFHLTIFGYCGPNSDSKARKLILDSWNDSPSYDINHLEVIDTADPSKVAENWKEYFPHNHNLIQTEFWESSIACWPRRTAEWKQLTSLYGIPCESFKPPATKVLSQIQDWYGDIASTEDVDDKHPKVKQN